MIPLLSPTPSFRRAPDQPRGFRAPRGAIRGVRIHYSDYHRALGRTSAQKAGLRYEDAIQRSLLERYPDGSYASAPHIHFQDDSGYRTCLPDGILTLDGVKYILEIKRAHCALAWWQLERLYRPLVATYYHDRQVRVCEIAKSFDPSIVFPAEPRRIQSIINLPSLLESDFGVLVWKP